MKGAWSDADRRFMREALQLAERGRGLTKPNPVVGAVLVKGGKVLARGFHRRAGLPHAEIEALGKLGTRAKGATLYVTLEPCCHQGRTGPCTDAILRSGVRRVVVGCCDENPLVSGRSIALLRRAGLRVDAGCLKDECQRENRAFFAWIRNKRPWVTLKVAATLDGCIGDRMEKRRRGAMRWITGTPARAAAHLLRADHDAVLVGVGTVLADNPRLTTRMGTLKGFPNPPAMVRGQQSWPAPHAIRMGTLKGFPNPPAMVRGQQSWPVPHAIRLAQAESKAKREPLRVVLDSHLRTHPSASLLDQPQAGPPLIVGTAPARSDRAFELRRRRLESAGAEVVLVAPDRNGRVALLPLLRMLAAREVQSLLVEGGSRIHGAFVGSGLVDSVAVFLAPRLVGSGVPIVEGRGLDWRKPAVLGPISVRKLGEDVLLTADVVDRGQRRHW